MKTIQDLTNEMLEISIILQSLGVSDESLEKCGRLIDEARPQATPDHPELITALEKADQMLKGYDPEFATFENVYF
ncbi:hypothetical protein [Vibrio phage CAU_VPP01]|nr:hypothetical protein [Vibrio phage CAU_VPP01]